MAHLRFVFHFHILRHYGQPSENIFPGCPNQKTKPESARPHDAEERVPIDMPKEGIQEEQCQVHDIHDC